MRSAYQPLNSEPNYVCDLIAAGIADEYLRRDPETRINCHVSGGNGALFITGETITTADFDVSQLVRRILATQGTFDNLEPFVAIEPVPSDRVGLTRQACSQATVVSGYACNETPEKIPQPVQIAKTIARVLYDKRQSDPDWFWLGLAGSVVVLEDKGKYQITIQTDHANSDVSKVRQDILELLQASNLPAERQITVNPLGALPKAGLDSVVGFSGQAIYPFGIWFPSAYNSAGLDWHNANVLGQWIARRSALKLLASSDSQAVFTRLVYIPGEMYPQTFWARDEKGMDLSKELKREDLHLQNAALEWKVPGLMTQAALFGGVGDQTLPWEII